MTLDRYRQAVIARLSDPAPSTILDLGAGTGIFISMWARMADVVIAVEPAPAMIDVARSRVADGAFFVRATAEDLPLTSGSIDVAWVSTALHHFRDLERASSEIGRVLSSNGQILIRTFVPHHTKWVAFDLFDAAAQARAQARNPTLKQIQDVFARRGFKSLRWTRYRRGSDRSRPQPTGWNGCGRPTRS